MSLSECLMQGSVFRLLGFSFFKIYCIKFNCIKFSHFCPVRKHLNFEVRSPSSASTSSKPPNITNHRSPLERYLLDAELQVSTQAKLVQKAEDKVNQFKLAIPVIENQSPACSLCHRREAIQMLVCLYLW